MKKDFEKKYLYFGLTSIIVIVVGIAVLFSFLRWKELSTQIGKINMTFMPIYLGLIMAYLMNPTLRFLENAILKPILEKIVKENKKQKTDRIEKINKISRIIGVTLTSILSIVLVFGLFALVIPQLYSSIDNLVHNMSGYIENLKKWVQDLFISRPELEKTVMDFLDNSYSMMINWINTDIIPNLSDFSEVFASLSSGVADFVTISMNVIIAFIVSIYVLSSKEKFSSQSKRILYSFLKNDFANEVINGVKYVDRVFGKFINGKIIDSFIIGVISFIVFRYFENMPYAILISVIIGVTNIIPFFGPFIGAIPCAILILLVDPVKCLIFVISIVIIQQFDGNILGPKILGESTGLSSFWVLFAILVGGGLFGFPGMVCGVPFFAVIYAAVKKISANRLLKKNLPYTTAEYNQALGVDLETNKIVYEDMSNQKNYLKDLFKIKKKEIDKEDKNKDENKDKNKA